MAALNRSVLMDGCSGKLRCGGAEREAPRLRHREEEREMGRGRKCGPDPVGRDSAYSLAKYSPDATMTAMTC